ncbi:hypothetical protein ZMTM_04200 [Methyloradius palustris]|uniref:Uncharacterized protein n=1 Tax=Methyloradius palustris TaxID=2778876 RepID=A0A8D5JQ51_9PROT|nr:hypothetical protein ZMTM_04200 [Methyloradius palustris]
MKRFNLAKEYAWLKAAAPLALATKPDLCVTKFRFHNKRWMSKTHPALYFLMSPDSHNLKYSVTVLSSKIRKFLIV